MLRRRLPEAAALRTFFQTHWDHLKALFDARQAEKLHRQQERERLDEAVEVVVDCTDARLRGLSGYQYELRQSTRDLLEHIENLAALIPAPVALSRDAYIKDPLVHLLFHNPAQMHDLCNRSETVRELFDMSEMQQANELFALLFVNLTEQHILGAEMRGEMLIKDVRQTSISFSGHRLVAPCSSERQARSTLKRLFFESVVAYLERLNLQMRYGRIDKPEHNGTIDPISSIDNPEVYLKILKAQMSIPKRLIRLQDKMLRVNSMGIKLPLEPHAGSSPVRLHELEVGEEQSQVLVLVRIPRSELGVLPEVQNLF